MQITIQINGLDDVIERFGSLTLQAIRDKMLESLQQNVVTNAKTRAPHKTGQLVDSIDVVPGDADYQINFVALRPYAPFLEFGTAPHEISVRSALALHWTKDGHDFFAKTVHHPGIEKGKFSFMWPALDSGIGDVVRDVSEFVVQALENGI